MKSCPLLLPLKILLFLFSLVPAAALADAPPATSGPPCADSMVAFCNAPATAPLAIYYQCILAHKEKLSPVCLLAAVAHERAHRDPCRDARLYYCKDLFPASKEEVKCMLSHKEKLSSACQEFVADDEKYRDFPCARDLAMFCHAAKDAPAQEHMPCLLAHREELFPDCYATLNFRRSRCFEPHRIYCKDKSAGTKASVDCLLTHKDKLPSDCLEQLTLQKKFKQLPAVCVKDDAAICVDPRLDTPPESDVEWHIGCMLIRKDDLSAACRAQLR